MPFKGYADTAEIVLLRQMLDEHCLDAGIEEDEHASEEAAHQIWELFTAGFYDLEKLKQFLVETNTLTGGQIRRHVRSYVDQHANWPQLQRRDRDEPAKWVH